MTSTSPPQLPMAPRRSHHFGAFDMDDYAIYRVMAVIGGILFLVAMYCLVRYCRSGASRTRVRKYDLMSAKDLQRTALAVDSDSEDDLFEPPAHDRQKLVTASS